MVIESILVTSHHPSLKKYHEREVERIQDLTDEDKDHETLTSEHDISVENITSNIKPIKISAWLGEMFLNPHP